MNNPIMLTPVDLFHMALAVCGAIITVSAAMAVVSKAISKAREPENAQNERIDALEKDVKEIKEHLKTNATTCAEHHQQLMAFEVSMKKRDELMIECFEVLINHAIDGNNIDGLKDQQHKISKYLLDR